MLTHFYCLEKWKRYTSPMYPMANELTCLDFSYFRLYVTFPQSQQVPPDCSVQLNMALLHGDVHPKASIPTKATLELCESRRKL